MREFKDVLQQMLKVAKNTEKVKFKDELKKIFDDSNTTAPELVWEIRGRQVSDLLYNYIVSGDEPEADWFVKTLQIFTQKPEKDLKDFIKLNHKGELKYA